MPYVNIRIWEETRRLLRLIAADSGEQMVEVMQRLCEEEWKKRTPELTPEQQVTPSVTKNKRRHNA
jgi:hypothetical protein